MADVPWISVVSRDEGAVLVEHVQAYRSLHLDANHEHQQAPLGVALLGKQVKTRVLKSLIGVQEPSTTAHGQLRLWSDPSTRSSSVPILYFDAELHNFTSPQNRTPQVGGGRQRKIVSMEHWRASAAREKRKMLGFEFSSAVLWPFAGVCCLFVADLGGFRGVAEALAVQAVRTPPPALPTSCLPRILVLCIGHRPVEVATMNQRLPAMISQQMKKLKPSARVDELERDLHAHHHSIRVVAADKDQTLAQQFRAALLDDIQAARAARASERLLFSFHHFKSFLGMALDQFASGVASPFHYVQQSRRDRPVSSEFSDHILELLRKLGGGERLWNSAIPIVASAILLDAYPPGMHHFPPIPVFEELYLATLAAACHRSQGSSTDQARMLVAVQEHLSTMYSCRALQPRLWSAAAVHLECLRSQHATLRTIKSHKTCFCCLMHMPEKVLSCGHALCETCVKIYGRKSITEKYTFSFSSCPLCGEPDGSTFHTVPPTAGIRALCIDGGGIRGVRPLEFLRKLQEGLEYLDCPLQDHFDFVCGTSSGGLIVLGMFIMQWPLLQCVELFENLAKKIFRKRTDGSQLFNRIQELVVSYLADSRYDSNVVEEALYTAFGTLRMFNPLSTQTKVAVTATTAREALPCIFTNYNGGRRSSEHDCSLIRAHDPEDDITVRDAARCTSAAPWFFKPKSVRNLGTFQDGGLRHNNPIHVALWESKYIWPDKQRHDFMLSLGTGTSSPAWAPVGQDNAPSTERFYLRLFKSFMTSMDGEKVWREYFSSLEPRERKRFHRFNVNPGTEIDLDDVLAIALLQAEAIEAVQKAPALMQSVLDSCHASAFYFELDELPELMPEYLSCTGHVYCRLHLSRTGRERLYSQLLSTAAHFTIDGRTTKCVETMPECIPPFRCKLKFTVQTLDHDVDISITNLVSEARSISGLPKPLRQIIRDQLLDCDFGRSDHVPLPKALPSPPAKRPRSSRASRRSGVVA